MDLKAPPQRHRDIGEAISIALSSVPLYLCGLFSR